MWYKNLLATDLRMLVGNAPYVLKKVTRNEIICYSVVVVANCVIISAKDILLLN